MLGFVVAWVLVRYEFPFKRLLDSLGLSQVQLQQLAGLLGNDHIKHISKDRVAALREAHPGTHAVKALALQVRDRVRLCLVCLCFLCVV